MLQFACKNGFDLGITEDFSIDYSQRYIDRLYSRPDARDPESLQLPGYSVADFGTTYRFNFNDNSKLSLRLNVNNLWATEYIVESATNIAAQPGDPTYLGGSCG